MRRWKTRFPSSFGLFQEAVAYIDERRDSGEVGGFQMRKRPMRRVRLRRGVLLLLVILLLQMLTASCDSRERVPTGAILSAMLACERDCPAGTIYSTAAEEGESGYLSEALCAALYGNGAVPSEWMLVESASIFLSAAHPAELAVFRCGSLRDAEILSKLCARRLAVLRGYFQGSEYEAYTAGGRVVILDNCVLMVVSSDADRAIAEARAVLR